MFFFIQGTKTSPAAIINNGYMKITGKAVHSDVQDTFSHFNKQVSKYAKEPANTTAVDISLSYVNATSKRSIVQFFKLLESMNEQGFEITVNWHFDSEDEELRELGEIFSSMFNIEIKLVPRI